MEKIASGREVYEYRVSKIAYDYFSHLLGDSSKNISSDNEFFSRVTREMNLGVAENLKSVRIPMKDFEEAKDSHASNPVNGRVYVLTDEMCFSSCLSFMDTILQIPGTVHIGRTTSADTVFMQTTDELSIVGGDLSFSVPVLRVQNRKRGHNKPYVPSRMFKGDISNTKTVEEWVLRL